MNKTIKIITERIIERSKSARAEYVSQMQLAEKNKRSREIMSCGNLAHAFAACDDHVKNKLSGNSSFNLAIVSAYNDMLSAHKPYENYPDKIRKAAEKNGAVAQFAGGVPAMCDGVTQGQQGMELSLLSRDIIAMSTVVALSHNMFDATICLGICDKIVPGQLIGSLKFGHLPTIFIPGGPMETGISNEEKAKIREDFAKGLISREELLKGESAAYHSAGTCTFYGTANSNQMLVELMGLHLPGSSFVNPTNPLRDALTEEAVKQLITITEEHNKVPLYKIISEKTIVNGIVGLLATGGSTNHTIHLVAIAKAAGIHINWEDFSEISKVVPSITRVYPNGTADINHFHAAGGMSVVIKTLLEKELLHEDVWTVKGKGLTQYTQEPFLQNNTIEFKEGPANSLDTSVIAAIGKPFDPEGGIKLIQGNIGVSVCKVSAVNPKNRIVEAPALVFNDQNDFVTAFNKSELNKDFIAVIRFQGPKANGMPELHKLTPMLSILQHNGHKVALVTDGRMSGASGKVPSAIHLTPEAKDGGILPLLRNGDLLRLNCEKGELECMNIDQVVKRTPEIEPETIPGTGRELFDKVRTLISSSETGATIF